MFVLSKKVKVKVKVKKVMVRMIKKAVKKVRLNQLSKNQKKRLKKSDSLEFKKMKSILESMRSDVKKMKNSAMQRLDEELVCNKTKIFYINFKSVK